MSWGECCGCTMAFCAACQRHVMVQYYCGIGSTNKLYRWQLGPNMWSSPTTKSFDPIVVTALRVGFPGEIHGPATCGPSCNCPKPEAWTMEASGSGGYKTNRMTESHMNAIIEHFTLISLYSQVYSQVMY